MRGSRKKYTRQTYISPKIRSSRLLESSFISFRLRLCFFRVSIHVRLPSSSFYSSTWVIVIVKELLDCFRPFLSFPQTPPLLPFKSCCFRLRRKKKSRTSLPFRLPFYSCDIFVMKSKTDRQEVFLLRSVVFTSFSLWTLLLFSTTREMSKSNDRLEPSPSHIILFLRCFYCPLLPVFSQFQDRKIVWETKNRLSSFFRQKVRHKFL